jgi:hypothetical protein
MLYRVHTRRAQLSLFNDDDLPKTITKPEPMSKCPHHRTFRKMSFLKMMKRSHGNSKSKPKI